MQAITNPRGRELTIGALSRATGVSVETIRYYEKSGLIEAPPRSPGGHRHYDASHMRRLNFVRRARELDFAIKDVRMLLTLAGEGPGVCADVRELAAVHLADVRAKRADLEKLERCLADTVAQCDARRRDTPAPDTCPVIDVLQS